MTGRPDGGGAFGTRSKSGDRGPGGGVGVVGCGADGGTGASGGGHLEPARVRWHDDIRRQVRICVSEGSLGFC